MTVERDARPTVATVRQTLRVRSRRQLASDVVEVTLEPPDGAPVSPYAPGTHLELDLGAGWIRQYSPCGPAEDGTYVIAVRIAQQGRGGSAHLAAAVQVGSTVTLTAVRENFRLHPVGYPVLIAGGIGITPVLAMARQLAASQRPWSMIYTGRSRSDMPYAELVAALAPDAVIRPDDEAGSLPDFRQLLAGMPPDAHIHCCGPEPMMAAVSTAVSALFGPDHYHSESFAPPPVQGQTFTVRLASDGTIIHIPPDHSILQCIRAVRSVLSSCEAGLCGTCETTVLGGIPEHRDYVLTDAERAAGKSMMICVSRSVTDELVLDL